ncbi:arginine--tRNA ligase [Virgibacillus sp. 179-BFC.A HS]|uniref:Arginine--tRNA ligase n=1 Tax=Tigheibacillus jepli TaxID=3035914 RepID=A0ABU5CJ85_9BACI|nr:arginine--tRNA ligase [Virgibacillus sp. 179-BFC.A HS]MDY0405565.1 arginine--tRNA ligase [Virgibacillus sp. 179-BFC.A HS]
MDFISIYSQQIARHINGMLSVEEIAEMMEEPKLTQHGDLAFPCFQLAKHMKQSPNEIAKWLAEKIKSPSIAKVEAIGPYMNCFMNKKRASKQILRTIYHQKQAYGTHQFGEGKTITIDFSSPNIAKPFSMGHLRSTVIGNAIALIAEKCGYQTVRINHLGDWGTQFGKLIVAYERWGDEKTVKANPIQALFALYVLFHEKAEKHPILNEEARACFKKLEDGDGEATQLWTWFRKESLKEFTKIYELLGVTFDAYTGEAFYNDKMQDVISMLQERDLLVRSDGADVVNLEEADLPPCLIRKSDGATLYATRDITAALYRQVHYQFDKAIYVVGQEQAIHFQQVFLVLQKLGFDWAGNMVHVPFGFMLKDGKKMSTRKGKVVLLEEVLAEAVKLAEQNIEEKNPALGNKADVAKKVGIGAVIFHDLKHDRQNSVAFNLEEMLQFEGATGPYVQYTHARACAILRKAPVSQDMVEGLDDEFSWPVIKKLHHFPEIVMASLHSYEPSKIARFLLELSQEFNRYYGKVKILHDDPHLHDRLVLVACSATVLKEGLRLLGIHAPEEM